MKIFYKIALGIGLTIDLFLAWLGFQAFFNDPRSGEFELGPTLFMSLIFILSMALFAGVPWLNLRSLKKEKRGILEFIVMNILTVIYLIMVGFVLMNFDGFLLAVSGA